MNQTRQILERKVTEPLLTSSVAKQSQSVREQLAQSISHASQLLAQKPAKGLHKALVIQGALEPMVRNANKVFGWDQQSSSTIASVQSLSSELPVLDQIEHNAKPSVQALTAGQPGEPIPDGK